jgi:hypothetical protein
MDLLMRRSSCFATRALLTKQYWSTLDTPLRTFVWLNNKKREKVMDDLVKERERETKRTRS